MKGLDGKIRVVICIAVDQYMRTAGPDIYTVGDAVEVCNLLTGKRQSFHLPVRPTNRGGWPRIISAARIRADTPVHRAPLWSSHLSVP